MKSVQLENLKLLKIILKLGISPKINKRGGSNNRVVGRIPQKSINLEVLTRHGKFSSKRIRKTPCLLESSE